MSRLVCHLTDVNLSTNYFSSIARLHDRENFPVMLGSVAPAGSLQESMRTLNVPTFALGANTRRQYFMAILRLARLLRRENVAILHAHCFDPTFIGLAAARLAGVPFVFTRHHSDHNIRLGRRWHTRLDSWCARRANHVIAVSEATRCVMINIEAVPSEQITVVYNGMQPLVEPTPARVQQVRQELGLGTELTCLMIARLHEEKGHCLLFDAVPHIVSQVGPIVILLAGDGAHREMLEAEVARRGLTSVVRFLGRRADIPELISLASVVVLPSLAESFGFALLEAMSMGKPVVASDTGGIPEVVADGETGLLVQAGISQKLAEAICQVLQDPQMARRLGEVGRQRAAQFTFERMIRGYEAVYQCLTA